MVCLEKVSLPLWRDAVEFAAEILEVIRVAAQADHFLDHRKEVSQRTNRAQGRRIGGPDSAARHRQQQGVFDDPQGDAPLIQLCGQYSIGRANGSHCARRFAIRLQDFAKYILPGRGRRPRFRPQPCNSRSDGPLMCTVWQ
jgi:hypothetical protein